MKKSWENRVGLKNKKVVIKKRVILVSALFFAAHISAMDIEPVDAELQVLVDDGGSAPVPTQVSAFAHAAGQQDGLSTQGVQSMQGTSDDAQLYNLIGEHNKHYFEKHDPEHVLRALDQLRLEQHLSFMALRQFDEVQKSGQSGVLVMRRKHHAKPRATQHTSPKAAQGVNPAERTHSKSALDRQNFARQNLDRQNNNACEQAEQEEKEREGELAVLTKGREKAQAELTTVLLSVLSQQLKEKADKSEEEKKQAHEELQEHKEQAAKKDKCAVCLKRTTGMVSILGVLATAWAAVMTASCAEHNGGGK
jgi:hypothetical protein